MVQLIPNLLRPDLRELDVGEKPRCNEDTSLRPVLLTLRRALRLLSQEKTMDRTVTSFGEEALARRKAMLKTAFGSVIADALADPQVVEVMVNPDGKLWIDRLDTGRSNTGTVLQWSEVERIIRLVASHIRLEVHERSPIVSAELPETGERFEGLIPPVAAAPCFSIRKPARLVHRLDDYVDQAIMPAPMAVWLKEAVLAADGPSTGIRPAFAGGHQGDSLERPTIGIQHSAAQHDAPCQIQSAEIQSLKDQLAKNSRLNTPFCRGPAFTLVADWVKPSCK